MAQRPKEAFSLKFKMHQGVFGPICLWFGQHVLPSFSGADSRVSSKEGLSYSQQLVQANGPSTSRVSNIFILSVPAL